MPPISVTVSSLKEVDQALRDNQINSINQAGTVTFVLHEQTPLEAAFALSVKTNPGNHGFKWENYELMKCKVKAKSELEEQFDTMLDGSLERVNAELERVELCVVTLRVLARSTDQDIDDMRLGTPLAERNQGPQQCVYPAPPFPEDPSFEHGNAQNTRVQNRPPYGTQAERNEAAVRDRRAQRAVWAAKLRIEEARLSLLKDFKLQMMSKMREELDRIMLEGSDLGVGYANYQHPRMA